MQIRLLPGKPLAVCSGIGTRWWRQAGRCGRPWIAASKRKGVENMAEKKKSIFDNIKVPLEDLTEEESRAMDNDPEFQKRLEKTIAEWDKLDSQFGRDKNCLLYTSMEPSRTMFIMNCSINSWSISSMEKASCWKDVYKRQIGG